MPAKKKSRKPVMSGPSAMAVGRPPRRLHRTLEERMEDQADLQTIRERQNEPGIPWEQVKRELGL